MKPKYAINQLLSHLKGEKKGRSGGDGDLMLSSESTKGLNVTMQNGYCVI